MRPTKEVILDGRYEPAVFFVPVVHYWASVIFVLYCCG